MEIARIQATSFYRRPRQTHEILEGIGKAYRRNVIPWLQVYIDKAEEQEEKRKVDLTDPEQVESYYWAMVNSTRRPDKKESEDK
jgi:hypothetical protein